MFILKCLVHFNKILVKKFTYAEGDRGMGGSSGWSCQVSSNMSKSIRKTGGLSETTPPPPGIDPELTHPYLRFAPVRQSGVKIIEFSGELPRCAQSPQKAENFIGRID